MSISSLFGNTRAVFLAAVLLRVGLLIQGHLQDQWSAIKYTDIDYFVFTDAAHYVAQGQSPYLRDTYRYTPLLAWLLVPTSWPGCFDFGKVLFAIGDIVTGTLILIILRSSMAMTHERALKYSCIWLLNPMVATISTRGSSEGVLAVMVITLLWASLNERYVLAGCLLGLAVHFKIYPFIYASSIIWWTSNLSAKRRAKSTSSIIESLLNLVKSLLNGPNLYLAFWSMLTFVSLNFAMYLIYGMPFMQHTYIYHLIRTDHRHNFSPYNVLLYFNSSPAATSTSRAESFAFIPQLLLSSIVIPLALAKTDLPSSMFAQTLAFVAFNKVCTSQYFLWYMVFLPFYLPNSSLRRRPQLGLTALTLWVAGQALWLQQGYQLEFLGRSSFLSGLWPSSLLFFAINVWIIGIIAVDVRIAAATTEQDIRSR